MRSLAAEGESVRADGNFITGDTELLTIFIESVDSCKLGFAVEGNKADSSLPSE
jgi:hypothetical protein